MSETIKHVEIDFKARTVKQTRSLAATAGSAAAWTGQINNLEERTKELRERAYRAGCYQVSAGLQEIERAIYKLRVNLELTPNIRS